MDSENLNYAKLSNVDLIQRYSDDPPDQDAFREIWKRNEQTVQRYATDLMYMCPPSFSRDLFRGDLLSATLGKVAEKLHQFEGRARLSTWLYRVMTREALQLHRKLTGREKKGPRSRVTVDEADLSDDFSVFRDKLKSDPLHRFSKRQTRTMVKGVVEKYIKSGGFDSYRVVCLFAVEEYRAPEIARLLGHPQHKIYRMRDHDYEALMALCKEAGIKGLFD